MAPKSLRFWWQTVRMAAALAALTGCRAEGAPSPAGDEPDEVTLSPAERQELLRLARTTLEVYLQEKRLFPYETDNPHLLREGGAFVTLKKHGQLRGCIGFMVGDGPVYSTIQEMAVSAAVHDPRFPPVRTGELADLDIEISLLTPLERVPSIDRIVVGKHGLLIRLDRRQGVFLPQVAPEQGWDLGELLENLCYKAGLPAGAWRDPEAELYWFTAEVFGEKC